jgi:hypothetical protein
MKNKKKMDAILKLFIHVSQVYHQVTLETGMDLVLPGSDRGFGVQE